ncbi:MAG: alpha/beta fold hydrolase [Candidatus Heimdallarchaeota archaeon]|nr:alpha/beta fold hydrolase [Candidatus Heimdallarchaeota archaeon]
MSIRQIIFEIETKQGLAKLYHRTPQGTGHPILFVHGFGSSASVWFSDDASLGFFFIDRGYDCWALHLSSDVSGEISTLAHEELLTAVHHIFTTRNQRITIIAHSMGGIIARVFTSPHFKHPYPLNKVERMIHGIALLAVPNHGVEAGDISQIETTVKSIRNMLLADKREEPLNIPPDLGLGFVQLTHKSQLIQRLNTPLVLNPNIRWINAVATYDRIVPRESALFSSSEVAKIPNFKQQEFECDHMAYPGVSTLKKVVKVIDLTTSSKLDEKLPFYPAIHRSEDVGTWILDELIKKQ